MAILPEADRVAVWAEANRALSDAHESCSIVKADLRAAIDAADQWVSDNAAPFNNALPVAARTGLTTAQKARLLMLVVARRFLAGA